eukprot:TRINITY_DN10001_c0_g1_i2.p1 TRINITY_DN10001_c0_g1~~TRINITY_DN10001_c0_g1_i2.p1  ORF type:complete len:846 (+),score=200.15 TRINITY_DN10001_c0_g1_i2:326-2539(+)
MSGVVTASGDEPPTLEKLEDSSPEAGIRALEAKVHAKLEQCAFAVERQQFQEALDTAKEAETLERQLSKQREQHLGADQLNFDLTFAVLVNLANVQQFAEEYTEAINTLLSLIKNKMFDRAGRLRINIGTIYFTQGKYFQAVKQYRMALDQVPAEQQGLRNKILKNIGHCFIKMGQYADAVKTYEHVLEQTPVRDVDGMEQREPGTDYETAFNCILCYFALGERDKMKRGFVRMLSLSLLSDPDGDKYLNVQEDPQVATFLDAVKDDRLRKRERRDRKQAEEWIMLSARLIAPVIDGSFADGFDWCIEKVKTSIFSRLAAELEIHKALEFLKMKEFKKAIKLLRAFEKKDSELLSTAATNLAFLYFLESDYKQADKYAERAIDADKYNPHAMVNKGNCLMVQEKYAEAVEFYHEALAVDSGCFEALYNLGLTHRKMGSLDDALDYFNKLYAMLPEHSEVVYQLAAIYEELEDLDQAAEWYDTLVGLVRTDPNALRHFGELHDKLDDKSEAFKYHFDSFRYFPSDIKTISWFGSYYIESQAIEKAIQYFERAAQVQPGQVKWRLMVASCHRRTGNYQKALETYKHIHRAFPDNVECLKFLVRICTDMDLPEAQDYAVALKRAEQLTERKESRNASARGASGRRGRSGKRSANKSGKSRNSSAAVKGQTSTRSSSRSSSGIDMPRDSAPAPQPAPQPTLDASYKDPIGALPMRPKTAVRRADDDEDEDWGELGDDMLPE